MAMDGTQPNGTVYQVWIDYDNRFISVMELGDSKSQFENYYTPWK